MKKSKKKKLDVTRKQPEQPQPQNVTPPAAGGQPPAPPAPPAGGMPNDPLAGLPTQGQFAQMLGV